MKSQTPLKDLAKTLDSARKEKKEIPPLSETLPFDVPTAYLIQKEGIKLREKDKEKVIGFKLGLTSAAKRAQMNLDSPIYGVLTDQMKLDLSQPTFSTHSLIHPKIEPEIALVTSKEIRPGASKEEIRSSIDKAYAALEIIDSRYRGFKYFSLPDVVADNCSASYFLIGESHPISGESDLDSLQIEFWKNQEKVGETKAAQDTGGPLLSVKLLSEMLSKTQESIPQGSWILTGAMLPAIDFTPNSRVSLRIVNRDIEISLTSS